MADFRNLADLYARRYAALDWKRAAFQYDALDLKPWLARIPSLRNDLDFYELMVEYVARLEDAHDQYLVPSYFEAQLGFTVDLYDGKALIDSIDRGALPEAEFPFRAGDEVVRVDGQSSADLVQYFSKYVAGGNPRTVARLAAELITSRVQAAYPYAAEIGDSAAVEIRRQSGETSTYTIPWHKTGTALTVLGSSPGPNGTTFGRPRSARRMADVPLYLQALQRLRNFKLARTVNVLGFDAVAPTFGWPSGFTQRLGRRGSDALYSGTYEAADGIRIGYLRIPDFEYISATDLDQEIQFFQANTDVLVVDVMRNPGGDACQAEEVAARLTTNPFQGVVAESRADWSDVLIFEQSLDEAEYFGADAETIALLRVYQEEYRDAFMNHQGHTRPLPLCAGSVERAPVAWAYNKPVLLLVDEMSASSADIFAALLQDNHIATLFGYRTMGAGGSPEGAYAGIYSEGWTTVSRSLVVRPQAVVTPEYPTSAYIENIGVRPEIGNDYMTADNLLNHGAAFVGAFTEAAVKLAKSGN